MLPPKRYSNLKAAGLLDPVDMAFDGLMDGDEEAEHPDQANNDLD